jgi:hypothetical protein
MQAILRELLRQMKSVRSQASGWPAQSLRLAVNGFRNDEGELGGDEKEESWKEGSSHPAVPTLLSSLSRMAAVSSLLMVLYPVS